ncbi:MAG TPA: hypothetical protein VGS57_19355, partial [Thermoanaerobaculia bacterium]|nr:hypothetical protein [Thermoanaerobaculia bacterium]
DTGTSPWVPVIRDNLNSGIKYTYVCLQHGGVQGAINDLRGVFRDFESLCQIVILDQIEFERYPYRHIVIYDPCNQGGEMDCYAEINAPERGFWLKLKREERNSVISRATSHLPLAKPIAAL